MRKFEGEEAIADEGMRERQEATDDPNFFAVRQEMIPTIEITTEWADEKGKGEECHSSAGNGFVGDKERIGGRWSVKEIPSASDEIETEERHY